jgi:CRP-like cAMP-binding protein
MAAAPRRVNRARRPELNIVEKVIALEGVDLFQGLEPEQLSRIASIATEVRCPPGHVVLVASQPLDALFVVLDGTVGLERDGVEMHVARQDDVLGAWALFDNEPMPVTATAIEDVRLLRIGRDDFYELLADHVEITTAIVGTLAKRFRKLVEP